MRHTVSAKKPKCIEEFSVIIPSAGIGRRMRSYGSKSLIELNNNEIVLTRQINIIKEKFPKSEIIVVTGFQSEKILKKITNVKTVENHWFEETSVLYSIGLGIRASTYNNILIIYGDLVFESQIFNFDFGGESFIITGNMSSDCVGTNIDKQNTVCYFNYGLPNKWCQIAFICSNSFEKFKEYSINKENAKLHTFEIFNKMIDKGHIFKNINRKGDLIEIENINDVEKAVQISRKI